MMLEMPASQADILGRATSEPSVDGVRADGEGFHADSWFATAGVHRRSCAQWKGSSQMTITLELPEDIAAQLSARGENLSRVALEAFGLEQYRAGRLTQAQLRRLLGFPTRMEVDGFLKAHGVELEYTSEDLARDRATHRQLER